MLRTERLELRLPVAADLDAMHRIVSDPQTSRFLGGVRPRDDHATRFLRNAGSWLLYGYGSYTVRLHGSEDVAGSIGVFHTFRGLGDDFDDHPEAGWILREDCAGQGLAREAMEAVLHWFEHVHGPRRIVCLIEKGNDASLGLAARLGFVAYREDTLPTGTPVVILERAPA